MAQANIIDHYRYWAKKLSKQKVPKENLHYRKTLWTIKTSKLVIAREVCSYTMYSFLRESDGGPEN